MIKHRTNRGWEAGCRERCCERARNSYLQNTRHTKVRWISGVEATDTLRDLVRRGHTYETLAKVTGLNPTTLSRWGSGEFTKVSATNYQKLRRAYSVDPGELGYVNSIGAKRRIEALSLKGFGARKISEVSGVSVSMILQIRSGKYYHRINTKIHNAIRSAFNNMMWLEDPSNPEAERCRKQAKEKGYLPFGVWDNIDDPDCEPDTIVEVDPGDSTLPPSMIEAIARCRSLAARGFQIKDIAEESGIPKSTLYKIVYGDRPGTKQEVLDKIQDACDIFEPLPDPEGPLAQKTRTLAAKRGWTVDPATM